MEKDNNAASRRCCVYFCTAVTAGVKSML